MLVDVQSKVEENLEVGRNKGIEFKTRSEREVALSISRQNNKQMDKRTPQTAAYIPVHE